VKVPGPLVLLLPTRTLYVLPTTSELAQITSLDPIPFAFDADIGVPVALAFQSSMETSNPLGLHTLIFATSATATKWNHTSFPIIPEIAAGICDEVELPKL
jgi:hypothetical protein